MFLHLRFSLIVAAVKSYPFLDPPTKPGDLGQLGHYRVIDAIGKGGMGHVFRAEDVKLKRAVALKVMNRKIAATPHSRRRFLHEARAMAAVHHDNVATIFEVGESKGTPFMAMEMLHGSTLEDLNHSNRQLGYEEIIELARQMSKGLAAAHAKGIVHRDIKPANIWVEEDSNRVKILDFGLALASSPIDHLAGRGAVVGTPGYLSPEQARSEPLDDRSDLYSLGVVLYELCTGRLPSDAKTVPIQLISILVHRPPPIEEFNEEIPEPLRNLIHRLLRKEPRTRPGSAKLLLEQLDTVEGECHVKSEVAQAINKLQLGLQEVVGKNNASSIFDVEVVPEVLADPLAASPAPPAPTAALTRTPTRPTPLKPTAASPPAWMAYWPLAAVVAVLMIALPLLTFAFTGVGRSNRPTLIVDDPVLMTSPQPTPAITRLSPKPSDSEQAVAIKSEDRSGQDRTIQNRSSQSRSEEPSDRANSATVSNESTNRRHNRAAVQPASQVAKPVIENRGTPDRVSREGVNQYPAAENPVSPSSPSSPSTQLASAGRKAGLNSGTAPPHTAAKPAAVERGLAATPTSDSRPEASGAAEPPAAKGEWTTISTAEGRGADAMVQNGSNQTFGSNLSLGVHTRGRIESNHSYLRFDLAAIEETRRWADAAQLELTVIGDERPIGASLRVYAVDVETWPEATVNWRRSYYSPRGLDSLPLLAEITVGRDVEPKDEGKNVIRISSPQLADAIANAKHDTLTLVIAGSGFEDSILRFISRERSASEAPRLVVRTPIEPPEPARGQGGRRRGGNRPIR